MRRLIAVLTATAVALGLTFVVAGVASATISSPTANQVLRGNATLTDSGASDGTLCASGTSPSTDLQLVNSGGTVVFTQNKSGTGSFTTTIDTHNYPNGAYTVRALEHKRSGFIICSSSTTTVNQPVSIDNITATSYTGATSAAQNTSATVSAKLTDPNKSPTGVAGKVVTFSLSGGVSVNGTTDANGIASASLPIAGPPRNATVTATFAGDTFFDGSSNGATFVVGRDASTTTVAAPADVVHGQPTQFTATVTKGEGTGSAVASGTVQFTVDGNNYGSPVALSGGTATSQSSTWPTGDHTIGAVYGGDGNYLGSSASTVTQHVLKAPTTTTLTQDVNPTVHGQAVTFTATVAVAAPGAGSPDGAVQFTVDGAALGTAVDMTGDHATVTITNLHAGNHTVVATYNGNGDFASSDSAQIVHGVDKAQTSVDLSTSDATAVSGQPLTFTAHVAPTGDGAGDPTGTVTFFAGGNQIGDPVPVVGGSATSDTTSLLVGDDQEIIATYSGDDDFAGSSDTLLQDVAAAHTTTSIDSHPNPSVFGQSVTVHAEVNPVSPATGHPVGTVKFVVDGGANVIFVDLDNGTADATLTGLAVGSHSVTAQYLSGDENFITSTSAALNQLVNKAATDTSVTSSSPNSVFGQPVTFTATVSVQSPGAGSPSGLVSFTDGSRILGTVPVDSSTNEQASIVISDLSVAQHTIVATYTGDGSFLGSDGSVAQKVERAHTSTVVTASVNPAQSGQPVSFTAQITPVAPGSGDPTGTVTFTVNGAHLGNPVMVSGGQATSSAFATLSPGTYRIEATYSGDGHFVGSSGSLDEGAGLNVAKGATSMTLDSAPNPADFGAPVTFTATVSAVAPATGLPSGVVQFWEGGKLLGANSLAAAAANTSTATFVSSTLTPGTHAIRAVYVGNFNFDGATQTTSQDVGQAGTTTGISSSPNPSTFGQDVTVTATVVGAPGTTGVPTGTVTFRDGTTVLGSAPVSTVSGSQQASLVVSGLEGGNHPLTAEYSGDESHAPSSSVPYTQQVNRAASAIHAETLITAHDASLDVRIGIVKATLTGLDGAPLAGQTVLFTTTRPGDHAVLPMCQAVTDSHGVATCVTPIQDTIVVALGAGYEATFPGNTDYLPATDHGSQL